MTIRQAAKGIRRKAVNLSMNDPLTLIFGNGDIGVATASPEMGGPANALVLHNLHSRHEIGESLSTPDGTTIGDIDALAVLIFNNTQSLDVVINALNRIKSEQVELNNVTV